MQFITSATILAFAGAALAADIGATGEITTFDAGLVGTITVLDSTTLNFTGITLEDASAPELYWWCSTTDELSEGVRINDEQVTEIIEEEDFLVEIENDYTADDCTIVGLWCERLEVNFGEAVLEGGSTDTAADADTTSSADDADETETADTDDDSDSGAGKVGAGAMVVAAAFAAFLV